MPLDRTRPADRIARVRSRPIRRQKLSEPRPLKSLAHGETESGLGLKIIQTPRIDDELLQQWQHLGVVNLRRQGAFQKSEFTRINVVRGRNDFGMQPVDVVRIIDAEWSLHNRQLHAKFDTRRTPQAEIRSPGNWQLAADVRTGELLLQGRKAVGIKLERACLRNAVRAGIEEQRSRDRADNGYAIFDVSRSLYVAAGERGGIGEDGNGEGPLKRGAGSGQRGRIGEREGLRGGRGNECDRRDGADVKSTKIVLPAHVE